MLLKVGTDDRQMWGEWSRKYKHEGNGIPIVYVIRADGKQLYGKSGTPSPLPLFLLSALKQGGQLLPEKQLKSLYRNFEAAERAHKAGDTAAAVTHLLQNLGTGSYSQVAVASTKLASTLNQEATDALEKATAGMESRTNQLASAIQLVQIEQTYGKLPEMRKVLPSALKKHRTNAETRPLMKQAETLVKAQSFQAAKKWRQAAASYQLVIDRHPNTAAAKLATQELEKVRSQPTTAASTAKPNNTPQPTSPTSKNDKQAASLLRLGKLLLKRNPKQARTYFMRVIKTAPDSPAAREARALLDKSK